MITTRQDTSYAIIRAAQHSACPHEIHYDGLRHLYKYLYQTRTQGIYYWRTEPNMALPDVPPPPIDSNFHDLLLDGRPIHNPLELYGHMNSDWAACPITRRSMGGGAIHLAGGAVAYKVNLLVTIAQSSTESEYMQSTALGKVILYARSIMWDLGVPQLTATIAYEDNDACTSMANARRPTSRTRHIDIKWHVLCQWIEQDLIKLERIPTALNIADIFTKQLGPLLFKRHCDYLMGRVPPQYSSAYQKLYKE